MRLSKGKLSVVISVSNVSTLRAIENEREAIAARLGSSQQPLETLVIRPDDAAQSKPGGNDAPDASDPHEARSNADQAGASFGGGRDRTKLLCASYAAISTAAALALASDVNARVTQPARACPTASVSCT